MRIGAGVDQVKTAKWMHAHRVRSEATGRKLSRTGDVASLRLCFAFLKVGECYGDVTTTITYIASGLRTMVLRPGNEDTEPMGHAVSFSRATSSLVYSWRCASSTQKIVGSPNETCSRATCSNGGVPLLDFSLLINFLPPVPFDSQPRYKRQSSPHEQNRDLEFHVTRPIISAKIGSARMARKANFFITAGRYFAPWLNGPEIGKALMSAIIWGLLV
jgi:hypothetical protein